MDALRYPRTRLDVPSRSGPPAGVRPSDFLPAIEALRGIAVLLVFAFHADRLLAMSLELSGVDTRAAVRTPWQAFVRSGDTGVTLFFVLSAFLLALPFIAEAGGGSRVDRGRYASRRALRILPLYWTLLAVAAAWLLLAGRSVSPVLPYAVFANGVVPTLTAVPPFTNVVWSLATEAQFYVLLPALPFVLKRPRLGAALLAAYAGAYGAWLAGLVPMTWQTAFVVALSIFGRGWIFLAGIAAAWIYHRHGAALRARAGAIPWLRNGGADALLVLVLLALGTLLLVMLRFRGLAASLPPLAVWHVPEGVCWALVVLLVLLAPLRVTPLLCNRPLMGLGVLSYSIYLWHLPVLKMLLWPLADHFGLRPEGWTATGIALVAALGLVVLAGSLLTYAGIERPFLRRKVRLRV